MGLKKLQLGDVSILLATEPRFAAAVRANPVWRHVVEPTMKFAAGAVASVVPAPKAAPPANGGSAGKDTPEYRERVARTAPFRWYHTIDLGYSATTPGVFDHRPILHEYPIPERLDGKRVLDVATYDGFWAFEFEKRGAAEVVALDVDCFEQLDLPPAVRAGMTKEELAKKTGERFAIAKDILGSKVRREVCNVYDLSPERLGTFDFVFCGDLLLHLMNPNKALQNIRKVTTGVALIVEYYNATLPLNTTAYMGGHHECVWWQYSYGALEQMIKDAGFSKVDCVNQFKLGGRDERPWMSHAAFRCEP